MALDDKNTSANPNEWAVWSNHVLKELERLNANYASINKELTEVKEELAVIKNQQTTLGELKQWKKEMDEITSPTQLQAMKTEIDSLKTFRTVSTTAWIIVQILFGALIALKDKIWP
jgi:predicted nuclease with TOPRIM domain